MCKNQNYQLYQNRVSMFLRGVTEGCTYLPDGGGLHRSRGREEWAELPPGGEERSVRNRRRLRWSDGRQPQPADAGQWWAGGSGAGIEAARQMRFSWGHRCNFRYLGPAVPRKRKKTVNTKFCERILLIWSTKWNLFMKNFHRWAVNRETILMSLLNPWFAIVMLQ